MFKNLFGYYYCLYMIVLHHQIGIMVCIRIKTRTHSDEQHILNHITIMTSSKLYKWWIVIIFHCSWIYYNHITVWDCTYHQMLFLWSNTRCCQWNIILDGWSWFKSKNQLVLHYLKLLIAFGLNYLLAQNFNVFAICTKLVVYKRHIILDIMCNTTTVSAWYDIVLSYQNNHIHNK